MMMVMIIPVRQSSGFVTRSNVRSLVGISNRRIFSVNNIVDSDGGQNQHSASSSLSASVSASSHWERLGAPIFVMAPMVAQSDLPFRRLCREHGTDLCFTQMIHASNFCESTHFQDSHLDIYHPGEKMSLSQSAVSALKGLDVDKGVQLKEASNQKLWTEYEEASDGMSTPLIAQIAGHDPDLMSEAAQIILRRTGEIIDGKYHGPVSGIDINCGCPQGIARKGKYGAFLMEESLDVVCDIVTRLRQDLPSEVLVSVKMRIPQHVGTSGDALLEERVQKLIDAGVSLLTIHGRNLKENKTNVAKCNWDAIAKVVKIAREYSQDDNFPIIANGGIEHPSDVQKCLDYTGASAVMSSEALLENPGIFESRAKDDMNLNPQHIFDRQIKFCHRYLDLCTLYPPVPGSLGKEGGSFNCMRSHLFKIIYRYLDEQPDLRTKLGHSTETISIADARQLINDLEGRYTSIPNWDDLKSSNVKTSSWYRRHRDAKLNSKMRKRGQKPESELSGLSIADKKAALKRRIQKLKDQNKNQSGVIKI